MSPPQQGKKFVKARRVLGNQQDSLPSPQQQQQVNKTPYSPKGERSQQQQLNRTFMPHQGNHLQSNSNKALFSEAGQQRQQQFTAPMQRVQPQYRAPPSNVDKIKYQPFQQNEESNFNSNSNKIPQYDNNRKGFKGYRQEVTYNSDDPPINLIPTMRTF